MYPNHQQGKDKPHMNRERIDRLHVQVVHGLRLVRDDHAVHHTIVTVQREDLVTGVEVTRVLPAYIGLGAPTHLNKNSLR